MTIGEARSAYYAQYQKFHQAAAEVYKQKEELLKQAKLHPEEAAGFSEEAATLELHYEALNTKSEEYLNYQSYIIEMEAAYANMKSSEQNAEAMKEQGEEMSKLIQTARRIMKGDIVPASDERKLMEFNKDLYMAAKAAAVMAKKHEEVESLWEDEEDKGEVEDPMEWADGQEAPMGGPSLDTEVCDVVAEAE